MKQDFLSLFTDDARFIKSDTKLQKLIRELSDYFSMESVLSLLSSNLSLFKNAIRFLNLLLYANRRRDSVAIRSYSSEELKIIIDTGEIGGYSEDILTEDLRQFLKSDYIYYKDISIDFENTPKVVHPSLELPKTLFDVSSSNAKSSSSKAINSVQSQCDSKAEVCSFLDSDFWTKAVSLDFPYPPQPNGLNIAYQLTKNNTQYCIYDEGVLPWNQSQISLLSDVNKFKDSDILKLFPPVRLYTRSPFMYHKYDKLDYDEDLGVLFKISGFNKRQIKKNIIEFPHLEHLDRVVKRRGEETTLEFWKHIEIEGQIYPTVSVWDELPDTKHLPKTESFMNEYVTRRYLLECQSGLEHKYPMRGTLEPFVTLYAPPSYYEAYKYDPIEIGRKCVESRVSFKRSRNPILKMIEYEQLSV